MPSGFFILLSIILFILYYFGIKIALRNYQKYIPKLKWWKLSLGFLVSSFTFYISG